MEELRLLQHRGSRRRPVVGEPCSPPSLTCLAVGPGRGPSSEAWTTFFIHKTALCGSFPLKLLRFIFTVDPRSHCKERDILLYVLCFLMFFSASLLQGSFLGVRPPCFICPTHHQTCFLGRVNGNMCPIRSSVGFQFSPLQTLS